MLVLVFTFLSIGMIIYINSRVVSMTPGEVLKEYDIELNETDRDYKMFDL